MRRPPTTTDAIGQRLPGVWQSANQFRLTCYRPRNTKKLSASPSRDRSNAASSPAERHADRVVGRQHRRVLSLPGRRRRVFARWHIDRRQLTAEDGDDFDRHSNRTPEPAEPSAVRDDKLDVSLRHAHDLPDEADRGIAVIEHGQTDEIADADGLRKAPEHALLHRHGL